MQQRKSQADGLRIDGGRTETGINVEPINDDPDDTTGAEQPDYVSDSRLRSMGLVRRKK